ncbi:MAG: integrase family protein [Herbinix sp.]|jgi:integrase|nr:integrase family protein [Herbinix sp.]
MARILIEKNIYFDEEKQLYYVYMDYGKDKNGKRIRKQPTFKTKALAKKALKEFEADKTKGTLIKPNADTLKEWLIYWYDTISKNNNEESTNYGYKNIIYKHIIPKIGDIRLQKLSPKDIQDYYNIKMNDDESALSANTVRKHHTLLKTSLALAVTQDILLVNPTDKVIPPKFMKPQRRYYDINTMKQLFALVKDTRLECAVWISGFTGVRRSELCGIKWSKISFDNKIITIDHTRVNVGTVIIEKDRTKNESSTRKIAINDELVEVLKKEKSKQELNKELLGDYYIDTDYVIVMEDGKPFRPNYLSELFTKVIKDNDLPTITLHGLRHTVASVANEAGVNLYNISKILGHSTTATTSKIYTHLFDEAQVESMNAIADLYK